MRDFRDAKAMARTLRSALAAKGLKVSHSDSLELIAQAFGLRDWNTLSAMLSAEPPEAADPSKAAAPPPLYAAARPARSGHVGFSRSLEETLHRSVAFATQRRHASATLEHLLLALADDQDAATVMKACGADVRGLRRALAAHLDAESAGAEDADAPRPTAGFQRVIQRAVIHIQTSGLEEVTGANVLVAIFSERESHAARFLIEHKLSRYDAVNFISHGVAKGGGTAAA